MAEQVEMKAKVVQSEVKAVTARHRKALEERECELLWKVRIALLVWIPGVDLWLPSMQGLKGLLERGRGPKGAWSFLCHALRRRQTCEKPATAMEMF